MRRVGLGVALVLAAALPAGAAPVQEPLAWSLRERQIMQPVGHETWCGDCVFTDWTTAEPWVVNPTACMWDVDDEFIYTGAGILYGHTSTTVTECLWQSGQHVAFSTRIGSPSDDLIVTYRFAWFGGGLEVTASPEWNPLDRNYLYRVCEQTRLLPDAPEVEVPGSHGGTAVPVTVSVTVENPTDRKAPRTGGRISFGWIPYLPDCG